MARDFNGSTDYLNFTLTTAQRAITVCTFAWWEYLDSNAQYKRPYHFTTGSTDIFCDAALVKNLANELGANILELDYGFHNPQHVFWTQEKLHKEIMR